MKVLIAGPSFGAFGGIESFVFALADALSKEDVDLTVRFKKTRPFLLRKSLEQRLRESDLDVGLVERGSSDLVRAIAKCDLVHCQNPSIDIVFLAKLLRKPVAVTVYNWRRRNLGWRPLLWGCANRLANRSWYISDFVWNSWEPRRRRPSSGKLPIVSNLPEGMVPTGERKGFVFVSRWIANKGLEELLRAYAGANLDRKRWPLVLVGDGPLRPSIEKIIDDLGVEGIEDLGFVDDESRNNVIRHAKWMVTPAKTKEDLGLTPIEARHVGVPCIISRDGGLPEAGGRYALVCEPGSVDQLRSLLEKAAALGEDKYESLCQKTHRELLEYLRPLSVYREEYAKLLN